MSPPPDAQQGFVDALLAAPLGVALLGLIEGTVRADVYEWASPDDSDPDAVRRAADEVRAWSFGRLAALAVNAGYLHVGPWISTAATTAAVAYRLAEVRRPIAEAISDAFGAELHRPVDVDAQEWWHNAADPQLITASRFATFEDVYGAGQFTHAGLWTVTSPPEEVHGELAAAWELDDLPPVSRWHVPVSRDARIVEIHRPDDWTAFVTEHPTRGRDDEEGWELPGRNQRRDELAVLTSRPEQRAARTAMRRHLVPDWRRVSADVDGVHLSWAGWITSEGCVTDLDGGDVAMLRYWFSERTLWLNDVFGAPTPLAAPALEV